MTTEKELKELKEKVELEKQKVATAEEVKKLNQELLRLQHQKAAKFADIAKDVPKILVKGLSCLGKITGELVKGLNKMDEKVNEMVAKEVEANKDKPKGDDLNKMIKEM